MKQSFKTVFSLTLIFCILTFSACKGKNETSSDISSDSSSLLLQTNIEINTTPDDIVDPENTENNIEGSKVQIENITHKKGENLGIDVSKWQGKIDWSSVKNSGIDFAIIRIGYRAENGKLYKDENADYNIQQAQKAGILVGVYFFSTAINTTEACEEASFVLSTIKGYKISYPVVYDCEGYTSSDSRMYNLSANDRTNNANSFLSLVQKSGYEGMFYGAKNEMENSNYWDMTQIEKKFKVWVAHYSSPTYPEIENPDYSRKYDMWQYTNRGSVNGVNGNCDMIVSYFTAVESDALDTTATPNNAIAPKTEEELLYTAANDRVTAKIEVNLREGPSPQYKVVTTLKSGKFLTRTGIGSNGWSRLSLNGKTVYAITSYLTDRVVEVEKEDIVAGFKFTQTNDRVTAKDEVNLRSLPATDSQIIGKLSGGIFLNRTAITSSGWSRLVYNDGQVVYAVTSYLTTTAPEITSSSEQISDNSTFTEYNTTFTKITPKNVTAKEEINLRDKPSTDSNIIYTLKNGEYISKVAESSSGWAKLLYNDQAVYAVDSFLK
ncbi:MAG: GH25 family lysozyme [Oscillospiraceae bacterium]|nr:GH25 family lysozyme [Oscillospiraceae bacterium]